MSNDYVLNYVLENRFYVEMESTLIAYFSECSGLSFKSKVERFYEGGVNDQERILVSPPKFKPVKLKRGVTNSPMFWEWINQVWDSQATTKRRNINIVMFNQAGETMQSWSLIGAIPIGWQSPKFKAKSKKVGIEELQVQYEGVKVVIGSGGGMTAPKERDSLGYFGSSGIETPNSSATGTGVASS
ncbi:MAG: phage tail protein [Spirulinaceae cyanobacterium RM2_2_10]|nr:phage tail protein [Spirulinaceae cyanobacterium SM2_1_0]NJO20037.1 phage tail protein [Spirulinaceae cyanobacterium RM2_2_10]